MEFTRFFYRQVQRQYAIDTSLRCGLCEGLGAKAQNRIRIAEDDNGRGDVRPHLRDEFEYAPQGGTARERALGGPLNHRTVRQRIRERDADFEHIGAGTVQRFQNVGGRREIRITGRDVRDEAGTPVGFDPRKRVGYPRRHFSTVFTSLSPRPDRLTRRMPDGPSSRATFIACATACDDSSAGRMPSSFASV